MRPRASAPGPAKYSRKGASLLIAHASIDDGLHLVVELGEDGGVGHARGEEGALAEVRRPKSRRSRRA